jgi:hypothetical protein
MDLTRAQRLLIKIQAFLDTGNGNDLSRLEKDLMKSYIIQLYDAVTSEGATIQEEKPKQKEYTPIQVVPPSPPVAPIHEMPKYEPPKPVVNEIVTPKVQDIPLEIKVPVQEPIEVVTKTEPTPVHIPIVEIIKEAVLVEKPQPTPMDTSENLAKLFEQPAVEEMSGRFSHIPIANIESALGLNERIFTLNDLFGGNRAMFESTCAELNELGSFAQARDLLLQGPARQFNWAHPERIKMAEHFIRIVSRRYPKA